MELFLDNEINSEFEQQGFVVLPFLDRLELSELNKIFVEDYAVDYKPDSGFFYSLMCDDVAKKSRTAKKINDLIKTKASTIFKDFKTCAESFLVKPPSGKNLFIHQDWSHTDESKHSIATLWCPLLEATLENGTLCVLQGSHRFFKNHRSETYPTFRIAIDSEIEKFLLPLIVPLGSAVFFHPALWHGSYCNNTTESRVIATALILPVEAPLIHYFRKDTNTALCLEMKSDYLLYQLKNLSEGKIPNSFTAFRETPYSHQQISSNQLIASLTSSITK